MEAEKVLKVRCHWASRDSDLKLEQSVRVAHLHMKTADHCHQEKRERERGEGKDIH